MSLISIVFGPLSFWNVCDLDDPFEMPMDPLLRIVLVPAVFPCYGPYGDALIFERLYFLNIVVVFLVSGHNKTPMKSIVFNCCVNSGKPSSPILS